MRSKIARAIVAASGPLIRTIPIPPGPGGVATAVIVSSGTYMMGPVGKTTRPIPRVFFDSLLRRNDDGFHECVTDTLGRCERVFRERQVHDSAGIRI